MWTYVYNLQPVLFSIGPIAVRWYGLAYVFGFLFAWWFYEKVLAPRNLLGFETKKLPDILLVALAGLLIGARSVYMLVYNFDAFIAAPARIFFIWEGGLSFHGALLGIVCALALYAKWQELPILRTADRLILPIPFALFFGRIANFINGELIGRPFTDGSFPICIKYPPETLCRYPSQMIQGLTEGLLLFFILQLLFWCTPLRKRPGVIFGLFFLLYGLFRFFTEYLRAPDPQVGFLWNTITMGQLLCIIMMIIGLVLVSFAYTNRNKNA